jgi:hypothetical protein
VDPFGLIQFLTNIVVFNITATSFDVAGNLGDSTTHYHPCSLDGVLEVATILAPPKTCRATYSSHWLCLSHHIGRSFAQLTSPGPRKIGFCWGHQWDCWRSHYHGAWYCFAVADGVTSTYG